MNKNYLELDYPLNLICDIYGISKEDLSNPHAYLLDEDKFNAVLSTLFTGWRLHLLALRYKEKLNDGEIATKWNNSRTRIAWHRNNILNELREFSLKNEIGFKSIVILDKRIDVLEEEVAELKRELFLLSKLDEKLIVEDNLASSREQVKTLHFNDIKTYGELKQKYQPFIKTDRDLDKEIENIYTILLENGMIKDVKFEEEKYNKAISDLHVSTRVKNSLRYSDIGTVRDFMREVHSIDDLRCLRNLGQQSEFELLAALKADGYDISYLRESCEPQVFTVNSGEKRLMEDRISCLEAENAKLKAKLAHCSSVLKSELVKLEGIM